MSWLGLADQKERRFSLRGIGHDRLSTRRHPNHDDYLLTRGSLVVEVEPGISEPLCGFQRKDKNECRFVLRLSGEGVVTLEQGETTSSAAITLDPPETQPDAGLRITFAWDWTCRWARLCIERPGSSAISLTDVPDCRPMALRDLRAMIMGRSPFGVGRSVIYAALSDELEPVGPTPGLHPTSLIETPFGPRKASDLQRGDTVLTRAGEVVPILHKLDRTVPARGSFEPVRLRAPYFGLNRDVLVAPEQRLVVGGADVEYLFNAETVLAPARHLTNGVLAVQDGSAPTAQYTQFILPQHKAIMVSGTSMESLYIGRLRRNRQLLAMTALRHLDRNSLPEHRRAAQLDLLGHEAVLLAQRRVA
jgi:hypothetical protein